MMYVTLTGVVVAQETLEVPKITHCHSEVKEGFLLDGS